ncbi:hypothetical protein [Treponema bryantii]|uniref:hypothetical protein n=1 Tax=Treponema bryantii TaxID=163 RepID=UPI002B2A9FD6|nr:hypothetical protein TRBR_01350 [Treponema bryantii]
MKRIFCLLLIILSTTILLAEEYPLIKIGEYENKKELNSISIRKDEEVAVSDDVTGNILTISNDGTMIIHCRDLDKLVKITKNFELEYLVDLKGIINSDATHLESVYDGKFLFSGSWADYVLINKNRNQIFSFNPLWDYDIRMDSKTSYYLEEANVLFFWDNKENIYCVVNPGMDKEENRKNFHNTEETKKIFESDVEINGVKIRVSSSNNVFLDGKRTYWDQTRMNDYMYQKVNMGNYYIYDRKNATRKKNEKISYDIYLTSDTEVIESSALHPSGDIYVLRMNWNTNTHNLYCIENTWDPQWRAQWYKEHSKN